MLIVLDIRYSLCQIAVWADSWGVEAVLDLAQELFNHRNSIFTDNDTFHFHGFDLAVPFMVSNVVNGKSFDGISIEDFLDEFFWRLGYKSWYQIIAIQNLFVQLACIWVLEWKISTGHCIQNNTTTPYIRVQTVVTFTSNHLWSSITWTTTCSFQSIAIIIHVWEAKVNYLDVVLVVEQKIFWLQISVTNANFMDILNTRYYLLEKPTCFILLQPFSLNDVVE